MTTKTENYQTDTELTLYDSSNYPLTVHITNVALTKKDGEFIDCRLTFYVNSNLYRRIDVNALFNLNPFVRISRTRGDFQPSPNIQIGLAE